MMLISFLTLLFLFSRLKAINGCDAIALAAKYHSVPVSNNNFLLSKIHCIVFLPGFQKGRDIEAS
jgi:hypothetical protein